MKYVLSIVSIAISLLAVGSSWIPPLVESQIALASARNLACFAARIVTTNLPKIKKKEDWIMVLPNADREIAAYSLKQIDYKSINYPEAMEYLVDIQFVMQRVDGFAKDGDFNAAEIRGLCERMRNNIKSLNKIVYKKTFMPSWLVNASPPGECPDPI